MAKQINKLPLVMKDLYGENVLYSSRPSYTYNPWLQPEEHQSNMLSARELLIAGMPVVVHKATVTDKTEALFNAVGFEMPEGYRIYETREDYERILREAVDNGEKLFFQYAHEASLVPGNQYVVPREKFLALNNKSILDQWTKGKYLPKRDVVSIDKFESVVREWTLPFVIKPGDEHPTAGGYGVMLCYTEEDVEKSIERVRKAEGTTQMIIEQFIEPVKNYCVQYAYREGGTPQFIGCSHQITEKYGKYRGNIIDHDIPQDVIDVGLEIMQNGVEAGYVGIAGFDLLVDIEGAIYAIDLNFRQNGSSSLLLLDSVLNGGYKKFLAYYSKGDNEAFYNAILEEVKAGYLFPLAYYDGDYREKNGFPSRFVCIWHGDERIIDERMKNFESEIL
ncbi:L-aspartate--L-methionine ligase LdmS [Macrococcoides caseolyticum]|uniref:L-aspartate--L-methionine ligase LdmS n=1 Tax=Macrococcoides caseolyticum TaxID=69966 RepID=UPI001F1F2E55|nr:ATP-grasp domain-containing protein [Macrococcus caseolyticus]MCE4957567.1 ATP-grasp domain-containing protein [Macrococcus caseolyticus]